MDNSVSMLRLQADLISSEAKYLGNGSSGLRNQRSTRNGEEYSPESNHLQGSCNPHQEGSGST